MKNQGDSGVFTCRYEAPYCALAVTAIFWALGAAAAEPGVEKPGAGAQARPLSLQMSDDIGDAQSAMSPTEGGAAALTQGGVAKSPSITDASAARGESPSPAPSIEIKPAVEPLKKPAPPRVRVPYLAAADKQRIVDEIRNEVIETAKRENWAVPGSLPAWVRKLHFYGDLLTRFEGDFYDKKNDSSQLNFQAINTGSPVNVQPPAQGQPITLPFLNTTENRQLLRLRLRFGFNADIDENLVASVRLATGNATNPVSANQSLGNDFNKLNFLVDRAYIRYSPLKSFSASLGRMPNPYSTATDLVWDRDLSFDGLALQWQPKFGANEVRLGSGVYLVENTDPNYPGNSLSKEPSHNKWLFGTQVELIRQINPEQSLSANLGYYNFINVQGQLSSPCYAPSTSVSCNTDDTRPGFEQKGNTLFEIRNLQLVNQGDPAYQYFGLASPFRIAAAGLSFDSKISGPLHAAIDVDFAQNLAFDKAKVGQMQPINNLGVCASSLSTCTQSFDGGNRAFQFQVRAGYPSPREFKQWQATLGYRRVETDAVLDAFTDSDFHLGGTNAKGYYVGAIFSFAHNATISARYLAGSEISGPPLTIDAAQLDVGVRF